MRAVKPIQTGEIIAENYGPIYSQMEKYSRQEKLLSQYWFKCDCIPCQELWPTFQELDNKIMRFRCNAPKNGIERKKCGNILLVPITSEDFLIKCPVCNEFTNLLKGLKELQVSEKQKQNSQLRQKHISIIMLLFFYNYRIQTHYTYGP